MRPDFKPTVLDIVLSTRCNLQCDYCPLTPSEAELDMQRVLDGVSWFLNFHLPVNPEKLSPRLRINIMGGEPLLERECLNAIVDCINAVRGTTGLDVRLAMKTNMLLLDLKTLRYLDDNHVVVRPRIDGCQEAHDAFRSDKAGNKTWALAEERSKDLIRIQPNSTVQMSVTPQTLYLYAESIKALQVLGFVNIHPVFPDLNPMPSEAFAELDIQVRKICDWWVDMVKDGDKMRISFIETVLNHLIQGGPSNICGAGINRIAIDGQGTIWPCHGFAGHPVEGWELGTVETGLSDDAMRMAQERAKGIFAIKQTAFCDGCELQSYCVPTCYWRMLAVSFSGVSPFTPTADYCQIQRIYYAEALRTFHMLKDADIPGRWNIDLPLLPGAAE